MDAKATIRRISPFIRYLIFILLMFTSLVLLQNYVILIFLVILATLPIVSVLFTRYALRNIAISIPDKLFITKKNEEATVKIEVKNPLPIPFPSCELTFQISNLYYPNHEIYTTSFPIYAKDASTINIPVTSHYSGLVNVHLIKTSMQDYFHFITFQVSLNLHVDVTVMPNLLLPIRLDDNIGTFGDEDVNENQNKGEDLSEVKNIREYQMGDRPQSIHWKLSSKRDSLLVKEHESLSSHQQILIFELYKDNSLLLDFILDMAYSLSHHLVSIHIDWKLMWWSEAIYDFKEVEIHAEDDLLTVFSDLYYEATYSSPHYALELLKQRETRMQNYLYVSKTNSNISGTEIAHIGSEVTAILITES